MSDLTARVDALELGQRDHHDRIGTLEDAVDVLKADLRELKVIVPTLATKSDLAQHETRMSQKIDGAINGVLHDALNSVPARYAAVSFGSLIAAGVGLLTLIHYLR